MNQVWRLVAECCIVLPTATAKGRQLYSAYRKWADETGEHSISVTLFGKRLTDQADIGKRHTDKGTLYEGIGLSAVA